MECIINDVHAWMQMELPLVDEAIHNYILGLLKQENRQTFEVNALYELIGPILLDAEVADTRIKAMCEYIINIGQTASMDMNGIKKELVALDVPLQMGELSKEMIEQSISENLWMHAKNDSFLVNKTKLAKAEKKIRAKQEKRLNSQNSEFSKEYHGNTTEKTDDDNEQSTSLSMSEGSVIKGKLKDIRLENFDISCYGKIILADANLTMAYGRRYGLIGRNGIGKSTLLKSIARREVNIPNHITILYVEQEVVGDETTAVQSVLSADTQRSGLLNQEESLSNILKSKDLSKEDRDLYTNRLNQTYLQLEDIEADKAEARASKILAGLGFTKDKQNWPTKAFSGGWRMRLALAQALFSQPDLLLLDEPTNMLDVKAVIWLENYLKKWAKTIFVVSHDREFLNIIATDIIHMHSMRLDPYKGNYDTYIKTKDERNLHQQREFDAQEQYRKHLQAFVDRWRCNANRASQAQSKLKILEKLPDLKAVEEEGGVNFKFSEPERLAPPVLQLHEVAFSYSSDHPLLSKLEFGLAMDSRVALIGVNGAGKSTVLKLITGELHPLSGYCQRNSKLRIGYFSQHHVDQLELSMTPVEFLQARFPGKPHEEYRRRLGAFGVTGGLALQTIKTLSGGQKSRVAFAVMSIPNPHILVLDEPTNHLDMETIDGLAEAMNLFKGGIIIVSHDERLIRSTCKELWICEDGTVKRFNGIFLDYKKLLEKECE